MNKLFIVIAVIAAGIYFRTGNLEGKMTFEWDQSRDYSEVERIVEKGQLPLLGPVVRGDIGGFYLGPLYYYLVTPLYYFSHGNPLALSVVSIGMDVVVIVVLFALLKKHNSSTSAMIAILIWAGSPLVIRDSYTPWNVSLISTWTLLFLSSLVKMHNTQRLRYKFAVIFLASLTANIHLSLAPVVVILLLVNVKSFVKLPFKQYLWLLLALLLPISTLLFYDATHNLENLRLLKQFMLTVTDKSGGTAQFTLLVLQKYGYTVGRLFTGEPYTYLGWLITAVVTVFALIKQRQLPLVRFSLLIIFTVVASLIYYHDLDFAEYYFLPTYVPTVIIISLLLSKLIENSCAYLRYVFILAIGCIYLYLAYSVRSEPISPYSLTVKKAVVSQMKELGYPVELRTSLPRERNTGFTYLMKQLNVTSDVTASKKAYIYESKNLEVIAPPEARSIILEKPIQAFKLIIFSN